MEIDERPLSRAEYQRLMLQVSGVETKLDLILSKVDMIADEVKPTLDALMASPMLKMLTGGKK